MRQFLLTLACLATVQAAPVLADQWDTAFHVTGADGVVNVLTTWNGDLVVGGSFAALGPQPAARVAVRVLGAWEPLGSGPIGEDVYDLAVYQGDLIALCRGTEYLETTVSRWNGDTWEQLGAALPAGTKVLTIFHDQLHAGSLVWDGAGWTELFTTNGWIFATTVWNDLLIAGGAFDSAAGQATGHVLAWDGNELVNLYGGQTENVEAVAVWRDELYIARTCLTDMAFDAGVQVWRDGSWNDVPELGSIHYFKPMHDLHATADRLYVCGDDHPPIIQNRDRWAYSFVNSWDGASGAVVFEADGYHQFREIMTTDDDLYIGGIFSTIGEPPASNIVRLESGNPQPVCPPGLGADATVRHLCPGAGGLAVGGYFTSAAGMVAQGVILHDGDAWHSRSLALGEPDDPQRLPLAMTWHLGKLSAQVSGHASVSMAYWDVDHWEIPDPWGWLPEVRELVSWRGLLLGRTSALLYDYSGYTEPEVYLELPAGCTIGAMLVEGADLVIGGDFESLDGVTLNNLGVWNGETWTALGTGLPGPVCHLTRWQGDLLAAYELDAEQNLGLAQWTGTAWQSLPDWTGTVIKDVADYRGRLYVSAVHTLEGGDLEPRVDRFDGEAWDEIGPFDSVVEQLAVHRDVLWLGGSFRNVAGIPAARLVTLTTGPMGVEEGPADPADVLPTAISLAAPAPNPFNPVTVLSFHLPTATEVRLEAYDLRGRRLATILDETRPAGAHTVTWTGTDDAGRALPSGTYVLYLDTGTRVFSTKATLVR
jgi:hypothetical protein